MFMMVSLAAANAHAFARRLQQTKQFCFKHQPQNRLMFMMFALAAADAHASTRPRLPDFLIHDSRFQISRLIPDFQIRTPQVSGGVSGVQMSRQICMP